MTINADKYYALKRVSIDYALIYTKIIREQFDDVTGALNAGLLHLDDDANPHTVTAEAVGFGEIEDYLIASEAESAAATVSDRYLDVQGARAYVRSRYSSVSGTAIPSPLTPEESTILATLLPELVASPYANAWGESRLTREFQVALKGTDFKALAWEGSANADTTTVTMNLEHQVGYEWRCRDIPTHGLPGGWSIAGRFTTTLAEVHPTVVQSQGDLENIALSEAFFTTEAFSSNPADTHTATTWRLWDTVNQTLVWSSVNDAENLLTVTLPVISLNPNTQYTLTATHHGQALGEGDPGELTFTTAQAYVVEPTGFSVENTSNVVSTTPTFNLPAFATVGLEDTLAKIEIFAVTDPGTEQEVRSPVAELTEYAASYTVLNQDALVANAAPVVFEVVYTGTLLGASSPVQTVPVTVVNAKTWVAISGGDGNDQLRGLATLSDGSFVVVGNQQSQEVVGGGVSEAYLSRWSSNGDLLWQRSLGSNQADLFSSVTVLSDDSIVAVGQWRYNATRYGTLITKWATDGTLLWQTSRSDSYDTGLNAVDAWSDDTFVVAGYKRYLKQAAQNYDFYVAKYNGDGTFLWEKRLGYNDNDILDGVTTLSDGGFVIGGYSTNSNNGSDGILAKFDASGSLVWKTAFGGISYDYVYGVASMSDGSVVAAGRQQSDNNAPGSTVATMLVKVSPTGVVQWQKSIEGTGADFFQDVTVLPDDTIIAVGSQSSDVVVGGEGNFDGLITKWDTNGNLLWQRALGGTAREQFFAVAALPYNCIVVGGHQNTVNNGTDLLSDSLLLAVIDAEGNTSDIPGLVGLSWHTPTLQTFETNLTVREPTLSIRTPFDLSPQAINLTVDDQTVFTVLHSVY